MALTPALLAEIGRAMHGERWQTGLAGDLGVNDRTVRRWAAGESAMPDGIVVELAQQLEQRGSNVKRLLGELQAITREAPE